MLGGVLPSLTQMTMIHVPASAAVGVQLKTLLDCHAGAVTSGIQVVVPAFWRNKANWVLDGVPPLAVAVQVRAVPYVAEAGLAVPVTVSCATICTCPGLKLAAWPLGGV